MTPSPDSSSFDAQGPADGHSTGSESDSPRRPRWSADTVETLVRFDEATPEDIERLESEVDTRAALEQLRAIDSFLETGGLLEKEGAGAQSSSTVSAESLYGFAHHELDEANARVVEAHLRDNAEEAAWVESLQRSSPPPPLHWTPESEGVSPGHDAALRRSSPALRPESAPEARPELHAVPPHEPSEPSTARKASTNPFPSWLAWTPMAAAALILAMAIGGGGRRSVLDGGLPDSPVLRSVHTEALLFPRGRVVASTDAVKTYANQPLFEVTPVEGASEYAFELRDVTAASAFQEGRVVWTSTSERNSATAPTLDPGSYTWTATARVNGLDRSLGSLSFTVVPATAMDRALFIRASTSNRDTVPGILREDIRRLHASGFLTDARCKARALPPGPERDAYLAIPVAE